MAELTSIASVCSPNDTFGGKSYSTWIEDWNKWLVSADILSDIQGNMCFTHGNLNYQYDKDGSARISNPLQEKYSRINEKGILVSSSTGIFIPIITSTRILGFRDYGGETLWTELELKNASMNDIDQGGYYYLKVKKGSMEYTLENLGDYRFETPLFDLEVSEKNPFLDKFEVPLEPGNFRAVTTGIFVILAFDKEGTYYVSFGGQGSGTYKTHAVYSFTILKEEEKGPQVIIESPGGKKLIKELKDASKLVGVFDIVDDEKVYEEKKKV
jgi:hypothetical protein